MHVIHVVKLEGVFTVAIFDFETSKIYKVIATLYPVRQLVFIGHLGWKCTFFLYSLKLTNIDVWLKHWMSSVLLQRWWEAVEGDRDTLCCFHILYDLQRCFQPTQPSCTSGVLFSNGIFLFQKKI